MVISVLNKLITNFIAPANHENDSLSKAQNERTQTVFNKILYGDGSSLEGKIDKYGQIKGIATFSYSDRSIYQGKFKDGLPHGKGVKTYPNGSSYEGEFKIGQFEGVGIHRNSDGAVYQGEFKDGKRNGKGRLTQSNGSYYEGEFKNDQPEGIGVNRDANDGSVYRGEFEKGLFNGKGKWIIPGDFIYEGEFKDGFFHENGTYQYEDGRRYIQKSREGKSDGDLSSCSENLGTLFFMQLILGKSENGSRTGSILSDMSHFLDEIGLDKYANELNNVMKPDALKCVLDSESSLFSPPYLINFSSNGHARLLRIKKSEQGYLLEIYNSGEGLKSHYSCHTSKHQFYTRKRVQIPDRSFKEFVCNILNIESQTTKKIDQIIERIEGYTRLTPSETCALQSPQKGKNCTLECVFSYLKNRLYDDFGPIEGKLAYDSVRKSFFEFVVKQCYLRNRIDPKDENAIDKLPLKERECVLALLKKIEKKTR